MIQIWALRSRLEKQPTDLRQNTSYFGDRTLGFIRNKIVDGRDRLPYSSNLRNLRNLRFQIRNLDLVLAHQARHFSKKLEILCEVGRIGFRSCIFSNVLIERFPFCHEGIAPCWVRIHSVDAAVAVVLCHGQPDRYVPDVRRVILDSDYLLSSVHFKVSIETCDPVDAGLKLANERAVIKGRGQVKAVTALRGKKHLARHAEQFTHRRKVMTTLSEHQRVGPPDSRR